MNTIVELGKERKNKEDRFIQNFEKYRKEI